MRTSLLALLVVAVATLAPTAALAADPIIGKCVDVVTPYGVSVTPCLP